MPIYIKLGHYWVAFCDNGYDIMETLFSLDAVKLIKLNVLEGHQNLMLKKITSL